MALCNRVVFVGSTMPSSEIENLVLHIEEAISPYDAANEGSANRLTVMAITSRSSPWFIWLFLVRDERLCRVCFPASSRCDGEVVGSSFFSHWVISAHSHQPIDLSS